MLLLAVSIMLTFPVNSHAAQTGTVLDKTDKSEDEPRTEPEQGGNRKPAAPIYCSIDSSSGITISRHSTDEILSYGIFDGYSEDCIGVFFSEAAFIETLFSLEGEFRVVFTYADYTLSGLVDIY